MKKILLLVGLFLFTGMAQASDQVDLYKQVLAAAQHGDSQKVSKVSQQLGDNFPLQMYWQYAELRHALPNVPVKRIKAFRHQYKNTPLTAPIYARALSAYARANQWKDFMALVEARPNSLTYRCYYAKALYQTGQVSKGVKEAQLVIAEHDSLPPSCRSLMTKLSKKAKLSTSDLTTLAYSAFRHQQSGWLNTLVKKLPKDSVNRQWLPKLYRSPETLMQVPKGAERGKLLELALWRLARQDSSKALELWKNIPGKLFVNSSVNRQIGQRIAWYSAISSDQPNREWLERWLRANPSTSQQTIEQRSRHAVEEQDWQDVLRWNALMTAANHNSSYWQYWRGRAYASLGKSGKAIASWRKAAKERNYYGFLAAEKLGLDYQLNDAGVGDATLHLNQQQQSGLARVRLLHQAGERTDALREWRYLLARVSHKNQHALSRYAENKGWYNFAIVATIQAKLWDNLPLRFPLAFQAELDALSGDIIPDHRYLAMAVARRESSFAPRAMSHVGARGLMQLMPGTAKQVAKRLGKQVSVADLFDVETNLELGTHYLGRLLSRYGDNRVLSLAAYNAGPSRVDRWVAGGEKPYDVWIESIPYRETRHYVQAVLTYRVIFMRLAGIDHKKIALLSNSERHFAYTTKAVELAQAETAK